MADNDIDQEMQTLEDVAEDLSELLTNSVNMVDKYYEIFFDQDPHYVELQQYGSDGQIYTTLVPNRAMDKTIALSGDVNPEGEVEATLGTLYINSLTRDLYLKKTDSGKIGWENITPQRLEMYKETFTVDSTTTSVEVTHNPYNKKYVDIYENGEHLEQADFDLDESNTQTILFNKVFADNTTLQVCYIDGLYGIKGDSGAGISSIEKISTEGLVDIYRITFSDGRTTVYSITNGNGINNIQKVSTSGLVDTYLITYTNGTSTTYRVTNGNGIASIEKISSVGIVDTYRINFTNGTSTTYEVSNGATAWGCLTGNISNQPDLQSALDTKVNITDIVDNVTTAVANKPLSANMGKELQDQIDNIKSIGRYLSNWNCITGLPTTNPTTSPYDYHTGDYFFISTIATGTGTNYRPSGSQYIIGTASTVVETSEVKTGDIYMYDGTTWQLLSNTQKTVSFQQIAGQPSDNANLATALDAKVNKNSDITAGTHTKITYDEKGLVTGGVDLQEADIPNLHLTKVYDVTASVEEVNVLDGITASTEELNYVDGVTSNIQTQLDAKQPTLVSGTNIKTINSASLLGSGDISVQPVATYDSVNERLVL